MYRKGRDQPETDADYSGKYEEAGRIGTRLVDGFYRSLDSLCQGITPKSVLEAGCGEGFSTQRIKRMLPAGSTFKALDVEQRLVDATTRRNPGVPVTIGSICDLPEDDASVDLVFALEVLEHLEQPREALAELQRVARRWVINSVPREPLWRILNMCRFKYLADCGNTPGHLQHWSSASFLQLLGDYGEIIAVRRPLPWTIVMWTPLR